LRVLAIVVTPLTPRAPDIVASPDDVNVPATVVSPELAVTLNLSPATVKSEFTARELDNVAAPVTPRFPRTAVLPVSDATENLFPFTVKVPEVLRVPAMVKAPLARVTKSGSPVGPIALPSKRTLSISTYPDVLLIAMPVPPV
jgi:hypothetical protein